MIYDPLKSNGFFILTWKSLISNRLFWGWGGGDYTYFLNDLLGVFLGEGGSVWTLGGGGGGSSKSGYLIPVKASLRTIVS